mmetsp:Transcript_51204/g.81319  ORF Transcript_51204/g.81319 Transcript_51204/m.81319 type:complete len:632 (-) Transcript_51204:65-1960(-)
MADITAEEVLLAIQSQLNDRRMRCIELFRKFDTSGSSDGEIHAVPFKAGLEELQLYLADDTIKMLFDFLDVDGDGGISLKELDRSLRTVERNAREDGVCLKDAAMKCGVNVFGTPKGISRASVLRKQRTSTLRLPLETAKAEDYLLLKVGEALQERKARTIDFFRRWDTSGSGKVSPKELRRGFEELGLLMNDQEYLLVMARLDKDQDGDVSISELDKTLRQAERLVHSPRRSNWQDLSNAASARHACFSNTHKRTSSDFTTLPGENSRDFIDFGDLESSPSRVPSSSFLPDAEECIASKKDDDPWPLFRYRPPKKPPIKPPTMGVAPRMCQTSARAATPAWAAVLGVSTDVDPTLGEKVDRSMVTIRDLGQAHSRASNSYAFTHPGPVEERQSAEWQLRGLIWDLKLHRMRYKGLLVPPGKSIASHCIYMAGVTGCLRFWPNGYFNYTQIKHYTDKADLGGMLVDSWCAIGLSMPAGTHLKLRFFVGDHFSQPRDCYWSDGSLVHQIWMPADRDPPEDVQNLVVGVEVLKNYRHLRPREAKPLKLTTPRREKLVTKLKQPWTARMPWSAREIAFPAVDSPPEAPRVHAMEMTRTMCSSRTDLGLALPSPRFLCAREMRRKPPHCEMAKVN